MTSVMRDAGVDLRADAGRVVAAFFLPGESTPGATSRTRSVLARILRAPAEEVAEQAASIRRDFEHRHPDLPELLRVNAAMVQPATGLDDPDRSLVIGAAFTAEYAVEGAALCNPSAVPHPDQSDVPDGGLRVLLSLRSIGEGHVSSIQFATAVIDAEGGWTAEPRPPLLVCAIVTDAEWHREHLRRCVEDRYGASDIAHAVLQSLPLVFSTAGLEDALREVPEQFRMHPAAQGRLEQLRSVGRSAYVAEFPQRSALGQRVLMPVSGEERKGMEDARLVRCTAEDGRVVYRGTYTAFDGERIATRIVETEDFRRFVVQRASGPSARTKGMALFPRAVGGEQLALTRGGGETISIARSADGLDWGEETAVHGPEFLWEVVQDGNCGSPIETERGWLVLTHGVGPMRRYCIGALLLDLDDPTRVIARSEHPLIEPGQGARDGYVPNVVYSCGGLVHRGVLWVPYAIGDQRIRVASAPLAALLDAMAPVAERR